eukprot:TRINITY_DN1772_c0_g1_i3.p2 TRINITY_DN1772_c0_g1~~TRINITY_DN1772_c0_g1_i3.p2  ORF type:complete len:258 (-),score=-15.65 TRINITY_DN1772_c0_g1_i3:513-1286(-)
MSQNPDIQIPTINKQVIGVIFAGRQGRRMTFWKYPLTSYTEHLIAHAYNIYTIDQTCSLQLSYISNQYPDKEIITFLLVSARISIMGSLQVTKLALRVQNTSSYRVVEMQACVFQKESSQQARTQILGRNQLTTSDTTSIQGCQCEQVLINANSLRVSGYFRVQVTTNFLSYGRLYRITLYTEHLKMYAYNICIIDIQLQIESIHYDQHILVVYLGDDNQIQVQKLHQFITFDASYTERFTMHVYNVRAYEQTKTKI